MIANYGYKDGSGDWFISIDTDRCNGCGKCCPLNSQPGYKEIIKGDIYGHADE